MSAPHQFAICVQNEGYPVSLELWKVYRMLPDRRAAKDQLVRIIDESGEDYLYDQSWFSDQVAASSKGSDAGGFCVMDENTSLIKRQRVIHTGHNFVQDGYNFCRPPSRAQRSFWITDPGLTPGALRCRPRRGLIELFYFGCR